MPNHRPPFAGRHRDVLARTVALVGLLAYLLVSLNRLAVFPPVGQDEPWIAAAPYKLATQGVLGLELFTGYYGMERHHYQGDSITVLTPPRPPAITTTSLTRRFDTLLAVDRLDLSIEPGTIFGLLGANGAGKSTTIKMLTTLLPASSGSAEVAGFDVSREPANVRQTIGYVPQLVSADGALTGTENMSLSASLYDIPRRTRAARIKEALSFMGLADAAEL